MKVEKDSKLDISNFDIISLKLLTRITLLDNIDEEMIDLIRDLQLEYTELINKYNILEEKANVDSKTSLLKYNEEFLVNIIKTISRYWQASQKVQQLPMSYIRLDLDDFHLINNRYGHYTGDKALFTLAGVIKQLSRPTDYIFRFGGEEFDIVLPVTPLEGAKVYIQKILNGIRNCVIRDEATSDTVKITASAGISCFHLDFAQMKTILSDDIVQRYHKVQNEADYACYYSKYLGKDQYQLYDPGINYKSIMREYSSRI